MRISWGASLTVPGANRLYDAIRGAYAFYAYARSNAVAVNNSHVQIYNPVGSGIQLLIHTAFIAVATTDDIEVLRFDTELTSDVGAGVNMFLGGAAANGHIRRQTNATILGTTLGVFQIIADISHSFLTPWSFELTPGQGLQFVPQTQNLAMDVNFTWIEL